jgi:hypothetical protein
MSVLAWVVVPLISILIPTFLIYSASPYVDTVNFVGYQPLPKLEFEGVLAKNEKLTTIKRLGEGILFFSIVSKFELLFFKFIIFIVLVFIKKFEILFFFFLFGGVNFVGYQPLPKLEFEGVLTKNEKLTTIKHLGEGMLSCFFITIILLYLFFYQSKEIFYYCIWFLSKKLKYCFLFILVSLL